MELRGQNSILFHLLISLVTVTLVQPFSLINHLKNLQPLVELVEEGGSGGCSPFTVGNDTECKYYGSCCNDTMRLRDMLQRGTFHCKTLNTTHGATSKSPQ